MSVENSYYVRAAIRDDSSTLWSSFSILTDESIAELRRALQSNTVLKCLALERRGGSVPQILTFGRRAPPASPDIPQVIQGLEKLWSRLESLDVRCNFGGDKCAVVIAQALKGKTTLQILVLHDSNVGDRGARAIAEALKDNTTLQKLYLHDNQIGDRGASAIAEALKDNTTLQKLYLHDNQIGDDGASAIAEALKGNTTLQELQLDLNQIGDRGASAIAEALKDNTTLKELHLYRNQIGNSGASAIGETLKDNTTLQILYLNNNQIGDDGASAIAEALKGNDTLQNLYLPHNQIGDDGASAIAEALKDNTALQYLDLRNNQITQVGIEWTQIPPSLRVQLGSNPLTSKCSIATAAAFLAVIDLTSFEVFRSAKFLKANKVPKKYQSSNRTVLRYLSVPEEYRKSREDIDRYLSFAEQGNVRFRRARVVMIGEYGQGKSWVVRSLRECPSPRNWIARFVGWRAPSVLPSTFAMETHSLDDESLDTTIVIQDLGGQQVYRTLQALLVHGNPLYLYCVNIARVTKDKDSLERFSHEVHLWLDVLLSSVRDEDGQEDAIHIMLVCTHADKVESEMTERLSKVESRVQAVIDSVRSPSGWTPIRIVSSCCVDNVSSLRGWFGDGHETTFRDLFAYVSAAALNATSSRYDPEVVPSVWKGALEVVTSLSAYGRVRCSWNDLVTKVTPLFSTTPSDDDVEFVLRLVREWTDIVYFRGANDHPLLREHVFLRGEWFVRTAGSLFLVHHHLAHKGDGTSERMCKKYGVEVRSTFSDDIVSDERDPPRFPLGVTLRSLDLGGHLQPLLQDSLISQELLGILVGSELPKLGLPYDEALSVVDAMLEQLDILVPVTDSAGIKSWMCPSLAGAIERQDNDGAPVDDDIQETSQRGHHRVYSLPRVMHELFYRVVVCVHRELSKLHGTSGTGMCAVPELNRERALWRDESAPSTHALMLVWAHREGEDSCLPELHVWVMGEDSGSHPFWDAVDSVLALPRWAKVFKNIGYTCPQSGCNGTYNMSLKKCVKCKAKATDDAIRYGLEVQTTNSHTAASRSLPHPLSPTDFVFVSYSWNDAASKDWVQSEFVPALRKLVPGRKIRLDIDDDSKTEQTREGKNEWMARMSRDAAVVIVVCSPAYKRSVKKHTGGVHLEYVHIHNRLTQESHNQIVTVLPEMHRGRFEDSVPINLRATPIALNMPDEMNALAQILKLK